MARGGSPGFSVVVKLTDQFTRPIANLNQKLAQSTGKLRSLAAVPGALFKATGLNQIGGAMANVGRSVLQLRSAITGVLGPFARLGVIAGGIGLGVLVTDAVKTGGELVKLSAKTGIAVEQLQRLQYAAKQEGIAAESVTGAIVKMNKALADATKPAKKLTEAQQGLRALGFSGAEVAKGTIQSSEAFLRVADAVARATTETNKMRIAQTFFGKSGAELLPILKLGRQGIEALGDGAAVMSEKTARAAKAFGDTMTTLAEHAKGLAYEVLEELLPSMNAAAGGVDAWLTANKEWLKTEIVAVVRDLVQMGKAFVALVKTDIIPVIHSLRPIWDGLVAIIGKGNAMMLAFTAVVAPSILIAILGIGKALIGLGVALAANPVGAAILAIAAGAILIYRNWGTIGPWIDKQMDRVKTALAGAREATTRWLESLVPEEVRAKWFAVAKAVDDAMQPVRAALDGSSRSFEEWLQGLVPDPIKAAWESFANWFAGPDIMGKIKGALDSVAGWIGDVLGAVERFLERLGLARTGSAEMPAGGIYGTVASPVATAQELYGGITAPAAAVTNILGETTAPVVPTNIYGSTKSEVATPQQLYGGFSDAGREITDSATDLAHSGQGVSASAMELANSGREVSAGAMELARSVQGGFNGQISVDFSGVPQGTRVAQGGSSPNLDINLNTSYAGPRGAAANAY